MKKSGPSISSVPLGDGVEEPAEEPGEAGPEFELRAWTAGPQQHGQRLDRVLAALAPEFSRSYLQQLIELGAVTLNQRVVSKPAARVKAADGGTIGLRPSAQSQAFRPELIPLDLVYSDEHLLVINKPAGLVVHPAPGNWSGTLLNGLLAFDAAFMDLPRAGIVHRLDKDTSGLMVVARSRPVMDALVRAIAARELGRHYLALAHRRWTGPPSRDVLAPMGRDPRNRLRMAVVDLALHPGKTARTEVTWLENAADACLLRCSLHTGRTHQVRVHLAWLGHPLLSDETYAGAVAAGMRRQALHAYQLVLDHPVTGLRMSFQAPLPADFQAALAHLALRYNFN